MKKLAIAIFGVLLLTAYSCEKDSDVTSTTPTPPVNTVKLTDQEISDLKFLREEEKLARDVYLYAFDKYGTQIFKNISNSEQSHMDQILVLLDSFEIVDPASPDTGVFNEPALQDLYVALTTTVDSSLVHALTVGATVEDLDISDIIHFTVNTDIPEIISMYSILECGSRNHIRGYTNQLNQQGATYVPQFLTQAEYDAIISGAHETCN